MQFAQDGTVVCLFDVGMMDTQMTQMNTSCTNLNTEDMLNWYDPLCTETDKSYITFSRWRPAWMASFTSWAKLSPRLLEILEMYSTRQVVYQRIYRYTAIAIFTALSNASQTHHAKCIQIIASKWLPSVAATKAPNDSAYDPWMAAVRVTTHCLQPLGVSPEVEIWMIMIWLYVTASPQPRWASNQFSEVNHWCELAV